MLSNDFIYLFQKVCISKSANDNHQKLVTARRMLGWKISNINPLVLLVKSVVCTSSDLSVHYVG